MAYSEATRVDEATARMDDTAGLRTAVRAAAKTYGETIEVALLAYGLSKQDTQYFRDGIIDSLRHLDAAALTAPPA